MKSVVLCVDEVSLTHPESLGLEGERLVAQTWLRTFSDAQEARAALMKAKEVAEVWVASNDDVEPINLAATLKRDRPDREVYLVSGGASGSLMSRANLAGVDGILSQSEFVARYAKWKKDDLRHAAECVRPIQVAPLGLNAVPPEAKHGKKDPLLGVRELELGSSAQQPANEIVLKPLGRHAAKAPVETEMPVAGTGGDVTAQSISAASLGSLVKRVGEVESRSENPAASPHRDNTSITLAKQAFLLPVISASGGSGKSAIAALASLLTHRAGLKTLLIDLDLQFGDMRETLGVESALSVDELLAAPSRIESLAVTADGPALLSAPRSLELAEDVIDRLPELLDLVCSRFDVVVTNTGSFWADEHLILLERCSRALFIVDQRPSSLRACQRALDLCNRCGIAVSPLVFAVNKCSKQGLYTSIDVSCALRGASAKELYWGGAQVEEMLSAGRAMELISSRNALVESLEIMLGELVPRMPQLEDARPVARFSLWNMLTGRAREEQSCR